MHVVLTWVLVVCGGDAGDGGGGVAFPQVLLPGGDVDCGDVTEGGVAQPGEDVVTQVGAVVLVGAGFDVQGLYPYDGPGGRYRGHAGTDGE